MYHDSTGTVPVPVTMTDMRIKKRYSHTKGGCKTCKTRKIRCDETYPTCTNCIRSNRHCSGVVARQVGLAFAAPLTLSRFPTTTGWLSASDSNFLDLFRRHLIGCMAEGSWRRLILQAVNEEPALCHAVIAFTADHEGETEAGARHQMKACNQMKQVAMRNDHTAVNVALMYALVCICYELRNGDLMPASIHLDSALDILNANLDQVDDDVVLAFVRLDNQSTAFTGLRLPIIDANILLSRKFVFGSQFKDAEFRVSCIMNRVLAFYRGPVSDYRYRNVQVVPEGASEEASVLWQELDDVEKFLDRCVLTESQNALLRLHHAETVVLLTGCIQRNESVYERCLQHFRRIVSASELLIENQSFGFSIDMVSVSALYMVAIKCRNNHLRRRAVELLGMTGTEGAWNGAMHVRIAEVVVELETDGELVHSVDIYPEIASRRAVLHIRQLRSGWYTTRHLVSW